jgi:hypothetical protein
LPPAISTQQPKLAGDARYADGTTGDFERDGTGRTTVRVPLSRGPGNYYVVAFAEKAPLRKGVPLRPATIVRVEAVP